MKIYYKEITKIGKNTWKIKRFDGFGDFLFYNIFMFFWNIFIVFPILLILFILNVIVYVIFLVVTLPFRLIFRRK